MAKKTRCEICDRTFKDTNGLEAHNNVKHPEKKIVERKPLPIKKIRNWSIVVVIVGLFLFGIILLIPNNAGLPPTDMKGHIESNPLSHILKKQMRIEVQKHMLEHADGVEGGKGGVIINYNCEDFLCEDELVENLEDFVNQYNYVYVAPFDGMTSKIALTKLNRIQTLEEYEETLIKEFIEKA